MDMVSIDVGLDYHEETIRVCVMDEEGEELVNRNVANDSQAVRDLVRRCGGRVRGVAIEACCGAADFATELEALTGWTVKLAHAGAVARLKAGPDKTDKGDAWHLANLLRVGYLPEVWLADEFTRQLRRLVRYRQGLVAERKQIKLRIRALLRRVPRAVALGRPCEWSVKSRGEEDTGGPKPPPVPPDRSIGDDLVQSFHDLVQFLRRHPS